MSAVAARSVSPSKPEFVLTPLLKPLDDLPIQAKQAGLRKISVNEYHSMIEHGILIEGEKVELLDGYLVRKMPKYPPHVIALARLRKLLEAFCGSSWHIRSQDPITLSKSEPEPDCAIIRGMIEDYSKRHPGPKDVPLVVEVADSTLPGDRRDKCRYYAEESLPVYWIVNLIDKQIEVYTSPAGSEYRDRTDYKPDQSVPLVLDGQTLEIPVADILPPS